MGGGDLLSCWLSLVLSCFGCLLAFWRDCVFCDDVSLVGIFLACRPESAMAGLLSTGNVGMVE